MSDPVELTVLAPLPSRSRGRAVRPAPDGQASKPPTCRNNGKGEGQPGSVLGRGEILRGLVGDPGRLELGVRSTKSSGRLDAISERTAGDQAGQADRRDPFVALGFVDP